MSCTHTEDCQLFPQFAAEPALKIWKQHFCEGDFKKCARYQRALTGVSVPLELLPNGKELQVARSKDEMSINVLFNAIQKNRVSMVNTIFKTKISEGGIRNSAGITPLMFAAELGNLNMVQLLLDLGCNPHLTNNSGKNALLMAKDHGHGKCALVIESAMKKIPAPEFIAESTTDEHENMSQVLKFLRLFNPFKRAS